MASVVVAVGVVLLAACDSGNDGAHAPGTGTTGGNPTGATLAPEQLLAGDTFRYVLPPGNYGGAPTSEHSLDQLPLYDGLTPRRGNVTERDIEQQFIPADFRPVEPSTVEPTGREGLEVRYDAYGIPHVTGKTRADVAYGAGWVTARDRQLLIQLALGPARAAVADVPGIDAFALVTSGQSFVPSPAAEALVEAQWELIYKTYGDEGREIRADAEAGAEGANAYFASKNITMRVTPNDVLAATAFIGSIFGAGGGAEVDNAELLSELQAGMGEARGRQAWEDAMFSHDPEEPTTIDRQFPYPALTGGDVVGSVSIDAGSVISTDSTPGGPPDPKGEQEGGGAGAGATPPGQVPAAGAPPARQASNFLVANPTRTGSGRSEAVMGPQLGYYYPEIVQQIHLKGPGFETQGAAVPGLNMYMLIGRTQDYAWSLTSAGHDVRDVYAEQLCEPDGSAPKRTSTHYMVDGSCKAMEVFDAGKLNGNDVTYPTTVHGPVIGTATSKGRPVALSRKRSTFGRDGLNLKALKDMSEGDAPTPERFFDVANQFEFTFNWGYANRADTAYFSSGRLPVRPKGLDRRLPTDGTGAHEWSGFLDRDAHPHATGGPNGLLLNWNNQSAPGFLHGDGLGEGPVHRVELFDRVPDKTKLTDLVGTMNRAATEDGRSLVWPLVSEVLRGSEPPDELSGRVVTLLDEWVRADAPRLDADDDGKFDDAGPTVMDALWVPLVSAGLAPVYGDRLDALDDTRRLSNIGASLLDKDLRRLLGKPVQGPLELSYCGGGDADACRRALWAAVQQITTKLAAERGPDPTKWLADGDRTTFQPGLIKETIRRTNRPTFQQVLELTRPDGH